MSIYIIFARKCVIVVVQRKVCEKTERERRTVERAESSVSVAIKKEIETSWLCERQSVVAEHERKQEKRVRQR